MRRRSHASGPRLRRVMAAGMVAALLMAAPIAHAQLQASASGPEGLGKALNYAGCAAGLAVSITPAQFWTAMFNCVRILVAEIGL